MVFILVVVVAVSCIFSPKAFAIGLNGDCRPQDPNSNCQCAHPLGDGTCDTSQAPIYICGCSPAAGCDRGLKCVHDVDNLYSCRNDSTCSGPACSVNNECGTGAPGSCPLGWQCQYNDRDVLHCVDVGPEVCQNSCGVAGRCGLGANAGHRCQADGTWTGVVSGCSGCGNVGDCGGTSSTNCAPDKKCTSIGLCNPDSFCTSDGTSSIGSVTLSAPTLTSFDCW